MRNIAFVLDNFRVMHVEQIDGVADAVRGEASVFGIELFTSSADYCFDTRTGQRFTRIRLFAGRERDKVGMFRGARRIIAECRRNRIGTVFISHYERPYIFLAAVILRLLGRKVYVLQDTKFDDRPRFLGRENLKRIMYWPYHGAIAASPRCADYLRFLGFSPGRIALNCYTTSLERVRSEAASEPAPGGVGHSDRNFLCVARLVPKKNHATLIAAYALYVAQVERPRRLVLCGSGPLEAEIRAQIARLDLSGLVDLKGNLGAAEVAVELAHGLCLLLPSSEEQYGIVVIEAQAMGLPVILSEVCGARDLQLRTGVNGFLVEHDNAAGLAFFMRWLAEDEAMWRAMAVEAARYAGKGDVVGFVRAATGLMHSDRPALGQYGSMGVERSSR